MRSTHTQSWAGSNLTVTVCKTGRKSQFITFICDPRNDICNVKGQRREKGSKRGRMRGGKQEKGEKWRRSENKGGLEEREEEKREKMHAG